MIRTSIANKGDKCTKCGKHGFVKLVNSEDGRSLILCELHSQKLIEGLRELEKQGPNSGRR